jgi:hypothetical protein
MPHPWLKRIRKTGQLTVFNKATAWAVPINAAIKSFNHLSLGVSLVAEKDEKAANIVLVLANRAGEQYKHYGDTAQTLPSFKADALHGQASTFLDKKLDEIFFAAIFLPGKVKKATDGQKEMIVVHELLHACGLDEWHDSDGLMFGVMQKKDDGLIEYLHEQDAKSMPPIRLGSQTVCKVKMLWVSAEACKDD